MNNGRGGGEGYKSRANALSGVGRVLLRGHEGWATEEEHAGGGYDDAASDRTKRVRRRKASERMMMLSHGGCVEG